MNSTTVLSLVLLVWVTYAFCLPFSGPCDSCGRECQSACGTRGFRACCLNYLKKRSAKTPAGPETSLRGMMVLPKLAEHYPSVGLLIPTAFDPNRMKPFFRRTGNEKSKDFRDVDYE